MSEDMKEFRTELSSVDGQISELEHLARQVILEDCELQCELENATHELQRVITEIQESQGWI